MAAEGRVRTRRRAYVSLALALAGLACFASIATMMIPRWMRAWPFPPSQDFLTVLALFAVAISAGIAATVAGGGEAETARATTVGAVGRVLGLLCLVIAAAGFLAFVAGLVVAMRNFT